MAKFAINSEGANSMKKLATDLVQSINCIDKTSQILEKHINSIENELGTYGTEIIYIARESRGRIKAIQESVNELAQRISYKGEEIITLLNFDASNDVFSSDFNEEKSNSTFSTMPRDYIANCLQPNRANPRDLPVSQFGFTRDTEGNQVYDSPMEMNDYLYKKQGSAKWNFQGTCGLCSCANILRLAGVNADEEQMINFASTTTAPNSLEKLCATGYFNPGRNGGTNPEGRRCILEHFGISSGLFDVDMDNSGGATQGTMNTIADLVSSGKGVILSVHADMLWHDAPYGINDYHAVTVTSVKKDNNGNVLGFYVCDSAKGGTTYYSNDKLRRALTGARMNVTHQIIR